MLFSRKSRAASTVFSIATVLFSSWLSVVQADITCASPNTGTFNAGDTITLDWSSDGASPGVGDIKSMIATLNCNNGIAISNVTITNWATPFNWTVPSVGNATTAGGTTGTCPGNAFHMRYTGSASKTYVLLPVTVQYDVSCQTITVNPAPNGTITTSTIASTTIATSTKSTATSTSKTTSTHPSPTDSSSNDSSGPSTSVIVIVAIVAVLILSLVAFGTWWYLRKQKIQRMRDAIMPWSNQPNNEFSKISSMDNGHRGQSSISGSAVGTVGAAAVASSYGSNKPQPDLPLPQKGYYQNEDYGYGQYGSDGGYGNYEGYNNADDYYNPNYAANSHGYGVNPNSNAAYFNGSRTPYQDSHDPYQRQQKQQAGYFPPPPPVSSNTPSMSTNAPHTTMTSPTVSSVSRMNSVGETTVLSSGSVRAPQVILPEMGSPSNEDTQP
ncbi:hypothetical protein BGZ49_007869, partial [Haplosporangium sp. Z 27]